MRGQIQREILLGSLLILALGVRILGLGWGLPFVYHPDEPIHVNIVLNILKTGDWNPHWFKYPSFRIYISVPVAIVYFLLSVSRGHVTSVQQLVAANVLHVGAGTTEVPGLYLALRLLMALFGVAGVAYVFAWSARNWNERVGWLAAGFVAISPLHVMVSHWYRPDTILALFSAAAVLSAVQVYRKGRVRDYAVCGLIAGLAASVKYNAAVIQLVPILFAHMLAGRSLLDRRLWLVPLVIGLVFLLITPYAFLDLPAFLDGFAFEINHYYVRGHAGADSTVGLLGNLAWYFARLSYYDGFLLVLAFLAIPLARREERAEVLILSVWPILVLALSASARVRTALAAVPLLIVLYLLAAISLDRIVALIAARLRSRWSRAVAMVASGLLVIGLPVVRVIQVDASFMQADVRTLAYDWINANLPNGARIAVESYGPPLEGEEIIRVPRLSQYTPAWFQAAGVDYLVASHWWTILSTPGLYPEEAEAYRHLFEFPLVQRIEGPLQYMVEPAKEFLIYQVPLPAYLDLDMAEREAPWLREGFWDTESNAGRHGRWTAERAVVELRLKAGQAYVVRVRGEPMRPLQAPRARTAVYLDDEFLDEHVWTDGPQEWSFALSLGAEGGASRRVRLVFETNSWRPQQTLGTSDERELGVFLYGISVEEVGR
ncbi:MAG: glycosyltransferase family 39 protein [Anaerolineae bacterium]|nr:glycosyltransferase family 39 protein [Anaerolineae bacterium]